LSSFSFPADYHSGFINVFSFLRNAKMMNKRKETPLNNDDAASSELSAVAPVGRAAQKASFNLANWTGIQKIFTALNQGVCITDTAGTIIQANKAVETITGFERKQIIGRRFSTLPWRVTCANGFPIPGERMPDVQALKLNKTICNTLVTLLQTDASPITLNITAAPLRNNQQQIEALFITLSRLAPIRMTEEALQIRNAILEAVSFAAKRLLLSLDWTTSLPEILERLGLAACVSRTYLFRNYVADDGESMTGQFAEWTVEYLESQQTNLDCQAHSWRGGGMERWIPLLSQGDVIHGNVSDFPESEKALLAPQGIKSLLVVPVTVDGQWWGFMGYDECTRERTWSAAEIDALKTAADMLGVAIERGRLDEQTRQLQQNLQDALTKVLSGYLPICAVCKKIRDENNEWRMVESYIRDHTELVFSHGICPECTKKFYRDDNIA
jgi:hypothetical protein